MRRLLELGAQVAEGLAKAHAAGMVHRDLKPENLMLTGDGLVKILDFGLAKPDPAAASGGSDEQDAARLTQPGTVVGTAGYMSPEQAGGDSVDFRSDQFALGAILYELATGRGPFQRRTPAETLTAILREEPTAVGTLNPQTPPGLARIVERCLAKAPSRRYASSLDLARDLREELDARLELRAVPRWPRAPAGGACPSPASRSAWSRRSRRRGSCRVSRPRRGPIGSLAILPFVNASGDPGLDYLSDGLTESLINSVSQLSNLKVIARSSVFRYKGKDVTPEEVAQQLKVQAVLIGRISERGDSLSVSAELVDAVENSHLWGVQYNRKPSDLLATQEDIAREISENLRHKLSGEEKKQLARHPTEDVEAYRLYMKGRYFWNQRTRDDLQKAIGYFRQAIDRDPAYALAYSGLADAYSTLGVFYYQFAPPRETFPLAREAAVKSLELDPSLGEAHNSLAYVRFYYDWDWASAEHEFKRALELNPADSNARHQYSHYLLALGRFDESLAEAQRAVEQDPLSPMMSTHLGEHYHLAREPDRASSSSSVPSSSIRASRPRTCSSATRTSRSASTPTPSASSNRWRTCSPARAACRPRSPESKHSRAGAPRRCGSSRSWPKIARVATSPRTTSAWGYAALGDAGPRDASGWRKPTPSAPRRSCTSRSSRSSIRCEVTALRRPRAARGSPALARWRRRRRDLQISARGPRAGARRTWRSRRPRG